MQIYNLALVESSKKNLIHWVIFLSILVLSILIYDGRDDIEQVEFWKRSLTKHALVQPINYPVDLETVKHLMSVLIHHSYPSTVLEKLIFNAGDVCLLGRTSDEFQFIAFFKMLQTSTFVKKIQVIEWQSQKNNMYRFSIRIEL
jgi:hypothetical protein